MVRKADYRLQTLLRAKKRGQELFAQSLPAAFLESKPTQLKDDLQPSNTRSQLFRTPQTWIYPVSPFCREGLDRCRLCLCLNMQSSSFKILVPLEILLILMAPSFNPALLSFYPLGDCVIRRLPAKDLVRGQ
jgi:hypothetical protein